MCFAPLLFCISYALLCGDGECDGIFNFWFICFRWLLPLIKHRNETHLFMVYFHTEFIWSAVHYLWCFQSKFGRISNEYHFRPLKCYVVLYHLSRYWFWCKWQWLLPSLFHRRCFISWMFGNSWFHLLVLSLSGPIC